MDHATHGQHPDPVEQTTVPSARPVPGPSTHAQHGSALAGRHVSEIAWPREAVLVAIERDGALLVPRGDFVLRSGDLASIFAAPAARPAVESLLAELAPEPGAAVPIVRPAT